MVQLATSGACAATAVVKNGKLVTAHAGDVRAVVATRRGTANGVAVSFETADHNFATSVSEVKRVESEHPGEHRIIRDDRLFADLEPSRSFGDHYWKYSADDKAVMCERIRSMK